MKNSYLLSLLSLSTIIACNAGDFFSDILQQEVEDYLQEKGEQQKEFNLYQYPHLALAQHIATNLSTDPSIDLEQITQSLKSLMKNKYAQKDMDLLSNCYHNITTGKCLSHSPYNNIRLIGKNLEKESRDLITAIVKHSEKLVRYGKPYELYKPTDAQQFKMYDLSNR